MKNNVPTIIAVILAILLAGGMFFRTFIQKRSFDKTVHESIKTTEGYDQKLINMVKRLEYDLALRASFGYRGHKDPMTGKKRKVVLPKKVFKKKIDKKEPEAVIDPVKLTAIIFDDEKTRYTAVVMDGERSYSVEVGDRVRDRRITRITEEMIYMENAEAYFAYDIYGNSKSKKKK